MKNQTHIAMWSGPRNISTAMMRAWGSRPDTFVCDEPLYAHYLKETELDHPARDQVIQHHDPNWRQVVEWLTGPVPGAETNGKTIFYQKHMAHHLLPNIDRAFLADLTHCFLIRDPKEMITSLIKHLPTATLADTGLPQQIEILEFMQERGMPAPPIIDARDVLEDPRAMLTALCDQLTVPFNDAMLSWERGLRDTDGIWAKHWYDAVAKSTCFAPYKQKDEQVPAEFQTLLNECKPLYDRLHEQRLRI